MTRIKRSNIAIKRRRKILKITQGFRGSSSNIFRAANQKKIKALNYSYRDRNHRKRQFRSIWIARLNATVHMWDLKYNQFVHSLKKSNMVLNRKTLTQLIIRDQNAFSQLIKLQKSN